MKRYKVFWEDFNRFLTHFGFYTVAQGLLVMHYEPAHLAMYLAYMDMHKIHPRTIIRRMHGILHHLKRINKPLFTEHPQLQLTIQALKLKAKELPNDSRKPISLDLLAQICQETLICSPTRCAALLHQAIFCMAFHGLLRAGEYTYSTKHSKPFRYEDITVAPDRITAVLRGSKASTSWQSINFFKMDSVTCPFSAALKYWQVRPPALGQFFIHLDGTQVSRPYVHRALQAALRFCNIDPGIVVDLGKKKSILKKAPFQEKKSTFLAKKITNFANKKHFWSKKKVLSKHYFINKKQQEST